jgi:ubiquinone/menaquinone biosynthesis C-methylase UbiE
MKPQPKNRAAPPSRTGAAKPGPQTDWGQVAQWYDQHVGDAGSEYHQKVVVPGTLRLLAPQSGESAIDVACGQGVLCRALHEKGIQVTGVDAATELIVAARERSGEAIRYLVGDARDLSFLPDARFAMAACVLAIQNMHPIAPIFANVSRLLTTQGRLVLVMMHPAFRGPKETSWGWDEENKVQYRRVDRYLTPRKSPIVTHPGSDPHHYTWSFHKPIGEYVKALRNAGLLIDAIEEWPSHKQSEPGPRSAAENQARKEIPMFMAIRAIKHGAPLMRPEEGPALSGG